MGSLLNINPIISMENGEIVAIGTERSRKRAYQRMVKLIQKNIGLGWRIQVAYTHAAALNKVLQLKNIVEKNFTVVESIISELPPALGAHTGPGTTGLCYFPIKK
jgi:fatty acid-binding protein DegV